MRTKLVKHTLPEQDGRRGRELPVMDSTGFRGLWLLQRRSAGACRAADRCGFPQAFAKATAEELA